MAFIRGKTRQTKSGPRTFYYLVETEHCADDKVQQRVIKYLGDYECKADAEEAHKNLLAQYRASHPPQKRGRKRKHADPLLQDSQRQQELERENKAQQALIAEMQERIVALEKQMAVPKTTIPARGHSNSRKRVPTIQQARPRP